MNLLNFSIFTGNLGRDSEVEYLPSGTPKVSMGIAVSNDRKVDGEWQRETTWVEVSFFGKTAENFASVCNKGDRVMVCCEYQKKTVRLDDDSYRSYHNFFVRDWKLLNRSQNGREEKDENVEEGEDSPFFSGPETTKDTPETDEDWNGIPF